MRIYARGKTYSIGSAHPLLTLRFTRDAQPWLNWRLKNMTAPGQQLLDAYRQGDLHIEKGNLHQLEQLVFMNAIVKPHHFFSRMGNSRRLAVREQIKRIYGFTFRPSYQLHGVNKNKLHKYWPGLPGAGKDPLRARLTRKFRFRFILVPKKMHGAASRQVRINALVLQAPASRVTALDFSCSPSPRPWIQADNFNQRTPEAKKSSVPSVSSTALPRRLPKTASTNSLLRELMRPQIKIGATTWTNGPTAPPTQWTDNFVRQETC